MDSFYALLFRILNVYRDKGCGIPLRYTFSLVFSIILFTRPDQNVMP